MLNTCEPSQVGSKLPVLQYSHPTVRRYELGDHLKPEVLAVMQRLFVQAHGYGAPASPGRVFEWSEQERLDADDELATHAIQAELDRSMPVKHAAHRDRLRAKAERVRALAPLPGRPTRQRPRLGRFAREVDAQLGGGHTERFDGLHGDVDRTEARERRMSRFTQLAEALAEPLAPGAKPLLHALGWPDRAQWPSALGDADRTGGNKRAGRVELGDWATDRPVANVPVEIPILDWADVAAVVAAIVKDESARRKESSEMCGTWRVAFDLMLRGAFAKTSSRIELGIAEQFGAFNLYGSLEPIRSVVQFMIARYSPHVVDGKLSLLGNSVDAPPDLGFPMHTVALEALGMLVGPALPAWFGEDLMKFAVARVTFGERGGGRCGERGVPQLAQLLRNPHLLQLELGSLPRAERVTDRLDALIASLDNAPPGGLVSARQLDAQAQLIATGFKLAALVGTAELERVVRTLI